MNSIKMDIMDSGGEEHTEDTTVIIEEDGENSISSEEEGAGVDCIARSRLRPLRDIWPSDEIVERLKEMDTWGAGELMCAERAEAALALEGAADISMLWACWLGKPHALALLVKGGADPQFRDTQGRSGLHLAALVGSAECVRILLQHKAQVSAWDHAQKATPLHCAASARSLACIQDLIKHGADVNAGINDRSPLHYAVQSEAAECVEELLKNGARPDTPQVYTETPLHVAAALGSASCAALLLRHGAATSASFGPGRLTALHLAAEDGHTACVKELLDQKASINTPNKRQQTALHLACIAQALDTVELLVKRGANMSARDQDGRTPLHAALGRTARGSDCARALLEAGADPNKPDNYGYTAVHLAALNEFSTCVNMLLDYGGDVTMRTKGGHSALSFIVRRTPEVLPYYLKKFDDAIRVVDHEIGDVDCELKLDFRPLVPLSTRSDFKAAEGEKTFGSMAGQARSESSLLLSFVEVGRRDVLKHPLCETFLHLKWKRIRKFFFASLVCHAVFVFLYTIYILGVYLRDCDSVQLRSAFSECGVPLGIKVVGYFLLFINALVVCKELFQAFHSPREYVLQWENWLQWLIIASVFMCAVPGEEDNIKEDVSNWQHHVAAIGIFLTWVELMLIVGRFPMFGLYVQMFATVAMNFSKFLMAYSCLLIAFALSFGVLFANFEPYYNIFLSLLKTIVMMSGELEYEDLFYAENKTEIRYPGTAHVTFTGFILLVTIILTNLLVGLAVSDIQALQESAGLDRLVRQAGEVARMEGLLFSPLLRWVPLRLLVLMHKGALLLSEPYRWALVIRPNDPRENRIPKVLISSIYKMVASRKEQAKTATRNTKYFIGTPTLPPKSSLHPNSMIKKNSILRPRTTSDVTNIAMKNFRSSLKQEPEVTVTQRMMDICDRMERFQKTMELKLAAFEATLDSLSKNDEQKS